MNETGLSTRAALANRGDNDRLKAWMWGTLAVGVPLLLVVYWFAVSRVYPRLDSAAYAQPIVSAYKLIETSGILSALSEMYWLRGWKPVFHPVLLFPALVLTGGNIMFSVALVNIAIFLVFLIFLHKFIRLFLSHFMSVVATWFIGTLPWIILSATMFTCEALLLAATVAALYFLSKCDYFGSKRNSLLLGIAMGMSIVAQPFLAVGNFALPGLIFIFRALMLRKIRALDVEMTLPPLVLIFIYFRIQTLSDPPLDPVRNPSWILVVGAALLASWLWFWGHLVRKRKLSPPFYLFNFACLAISLLWLGPFIGKLFMWFSESTFSTVAFVLGYRGTYYSNLMNEFGNNFLWIVSGFLAASWVLLISMNRRPQEGKFNLIFLVPFILVPPIIGAQTNNMDPRYYYACATVLFMLSAIQTLRLSPGIAAWLLKGSFIMCAFLSIAISASSVFNKSHWLPISRLTTIIDYQRYNLTPNNATQPIASFLKGLCQAAGVTSNDTRWIVLLVNDEAGWVPDESELDLFLTEIGLKIIIRRPWMLYNQPEDKPPLEILRQHYPLLVLGLTERSNFGVWDPIAYRLTNELLYHYKKGRLSDLGLAIAGEFELDRQKTKYLVLNTRP